MIEENRAITSSIWCIRLALFSVALLAVTVLFHRIFGMSTLVALNLFKLIFVLSTLAIGIGLFALARIWQRGWPGGSNAVTGIVLSLAILAWPMVVWSFVKHFPMINDVTTDTRMPPKFILLAQKRRKGANPIAYPGAEFVRRQEAAYKDLAPLRINRSASETLDLVRQALGRLRMTVAGVIPIGSKGRGWGQVEAVDRTLVLGFYDDVVVRVSRVRGGSLVDIRSASQFGKSDLGRNAERIRAVQREIIARVQATVPASRRRGKSRKK